MLSFVPFVNTLAPKAALGSFLVLSALSSSGITGNSIAYKALASGDSSQAASDMASANTASPQDPYFELDFGLAYQNAGRMDLAEPFYRVAMIDGANVVPPLTTNASDKGKTIGQIACENLRIGYGMDNVC
jgi:hypothetical protein